MDRLFRVFIFLFCHDRFSVLVKQRGKACRVSILVKQVIDACRSIHPYFANINHTL